MGWREFRAWLRELSRQQDQIAGQGQMSPDSWDNYENDAFFARQREKQARMRGR